MGSVDGQTKLKVKAYAKMLVRWPNEIVRKDGGRELRAAENHQSLPFAVTFHPAASTKIVPEEQEAGATPTTARCAAA